MVQIEQKKEQTYGVRTPNCRQQKGQKFIKGSKPLQNVPHSVTRDAGIMVRNTMGVRQGRKRTKKKQTGGRDPIGKKNANQEKLDKESPGCILPKNFARKKMWGPPVGVSGNVVLAVGEGDPGW